MTPLDLVHPRAQECDDVDQVAEAARDRALRLVHAGLPLSSKELALVLRYGLSQFHKQAKRGVFEDFRLRPALGPKRYSGVLVGRYLRGEVVDAPMRVFGRKGVR